MQVLTYKFEVAKSPQEAFEEATKKKHLRESIIELGKIKIQNEEINEEVYKLGDKELIQYTMLKELIKAQSKMVVTEYIKPYKITEVWIGGVFGDFRFEQEIQQTETGSEIIYNIEYECNLPSIVRGKVEKNKINPYLEKLMKKRANKIIGTNKKFKIERGDYEDGEETFE